MTSNEQTVPFSGSHPMVAIDVVPIAVAPTLDVVIGTSLRVGDPFAGTWALPGVLLKPQEVLDRAADRALVSKAAIPVADMLFKCQIGAFDTPGRDPREPVISIAYLVVCQYAENPHVRWLRRPAHLPFDHDVIIQRAWEMARVRWLSDLGFTRSLVGSEFSMSNAAQIGQSISGIWRRPSNLTRTLVATGKIARGSTNKVRGAGRPATLWVWQ